MPPHPPAAPPAAVALRRPSARRWGRHPFRRPGLFWPAAVLVAALTGLVVARLLGAAAADAARFGELAPVLVATRPVAAGEAVTDAVAERRELPVALVPDGALRGEPAGQVATVALHPGEVVLEARVAPAGLSPTAARLPPGTRGVAVPTGAAGLGLRPGDRVDVLATMEPTADGAALAEPTFPVARAATVVATADDGATATVAVTEREAPRVAFAVTTGSVTLLLTGAAP